MNKIETILKLIGFDGAAIQKLTDDKISDEDFKSSLETAEKEWRTEYNESIVTDSKASIKKEVRDEIKEETEKGYIAQRYKEIKVAIAKKLNLPGTLTEIKAMEEEQFLDLLEKNSSKFSDEEKKKYEDALQKANTENETLTKKYEDLEKEIPSKYIDRSKYEQKIKDKSWTESVTSLETGDLSKDDAVIILQGRASKKGWTPYVKDDETIGFKDKDGNVVKNDKMKEVLLSEFIAAEAESLKPKNAGAPADPKKKEGGEDVYISKAAQGMQ